MPVPLLLQAGLQAGVNTVNNLLNRGAQRQEFRQNRRMSELAYSQDLDMWNRQSNWNREMWELQNEYNLPANQMQRLRDAGLNPNLIYGNAAAGGQAAKIESAQMPKYNPARANYSYLPVQVPDMLNMYQNFKLKDAQIDNVKAQTDVANERALTEAQLRLPRYQSYKYGNAIKYVNSRYQQAFNELQLDQNKQRLENLKADKLLKDLEIPYRKSRNTIKGQEADWLKQYGIRQQDPLYMRLLMRMFESMGFDKILPNN